KSQAKLRRSACLKYSPNSFQFRRGARSFHPITELQNEYCTGRRTQQAFEISTRTRDQKVVTKLIRIDGNRDGNRTDRLSPCRAPGPSRRAHRPDRRVTPGCGSPDDATKREPWPIRGPPWLATNPTRQLSPARTSRQRISYRRFVPVAHRSGTNLSTHRPTPADLRPRLSAMHRDTPRRRGSRRRASRRGVRAHSPPGSAESTWLRSRQNANGRAAPVFGRRATV